MEKQKLKDPGYYLTLFKIEGHETYRAHLSNRKDGFEKDVTPNVKVIERKVTRFDRINGAASLL